MQLLAASGVKVTKSFRIVGEPMWWRSRVGELERNVPVGVFLEFVNDAASHLGVPLPAGTVRLYKQDEGGAKQLIGEDTLAHTPATSAWCSRPATPSTSSPHARRRTTAR
jgi:hypothetical protein